MKYWFIAIVSLLFSILQLNAQQRVIAECMVTYIISVDSSTDNSLIENLKSASKTVYIKGNNCRTDLTSPSFKQSIFYDKTKGSAIILREFGNNKFITKLDSTTWLKEYIEFDSMTTTITKETRKIIGYDCKKAILQLRNGKIYELYFTTTLLPSVREFEYEFKDIPGFVLSYQVQPKEGKKISYTATKMNLSPVQISKFDIPSTGYRFLEK